MGNTANSLIKAAITTANPKTFRVETRHPWSGMQMALRATIHCAGAADLYIDLGDGEWYLAKALSAGVTILPELHGDRFQLRGDTTITLKSELQISE